MLPFKLVQNKEWELCKSALDCYRINQERNLIQKWMKWVYLKGSNAENNKKMFSNFDFNWMVKSQEKINYTQHFSRPDFVAYFKRTGI